MRLCHSVLAGVRIKLVNFREKYMSFSSGQMKCPGVRRVGFHFIGNQHEKNEN